MKIKQAVILAGGQGKRLAPLTNDTPKCMLDINGKPFLYYLIKKLKEQGIEEVILCVGYLGHKIIDYFNNGESLGIKIKYSWQEKKINTASRVKTIEHLIDENFLLLYSDNYYDLKLRILEKIEAPALIAYNNMGGKGEYGFENNLEVFHWTALNYDYTRKNPNLNCVNIGFMLLNKKHIALIEGNKTIEEELFPILIRNKELKAYLTFKPYYWLTDVESLQKMREVLK